MNRNSAGSREAILGTIRSTLGKSAESLTKRNEAVEARLAARPRTAPPQRVATAGNDLAAVLRDEMTRQLIDIAEAETIEAVPLRIAEYLRRHELPLKLRHGTHRLYGGMDFAAAGISPATGPAQPDDSAGLSTAFSAIAETGTLAILSGADNPVTLEFLPETHIVIVPMDRIVATYEDAFDMLRAENATAMPRTLNLISGPSRTADIGGRIVIGAHGPRRLLAVLLSGH